MDEMMEESIGECIFLLPRRRKPSFLQRIKDAWNNSPPGLKTAWAFLILLSFAVTLVCVQFKNPVDTDIDEFLEENEINVTVLEPSDRIVLLAELRTKNPTALHMRKLMVLLQGNTPREKEKMWLGSATKNTESEVLIMCSLLLENMKLAINKCVNIDVLPTFCTKLINKKFNCSPSSKYRTIDGSCNNLENPSWGMQGAANRRWLTAAYSDDVSSPRVSVTGKPLPNARYISSTLFSHSTRPESNITMLFAYFGLFIDHDMVRAGQTQANLHKCCNKEYVNPACFSFSVAPNDYFYGPMNVSCLGFLRNVPTVGECPGRREQQNLMTAFLDASDTYGPTDEQCNDLRLFKGGRLRSTVYNNNTVLLPLNKNAGNSCYTSHTHHQCFASGDIRTNMLLPLMTLHAVWAREHNRLANELKKLKPKWNDEKLFQEARRINIAELQHITYNEFLPIIFGRSKMKEYELLIEKDKIYEGYDPTEDATLRNAFSTAAFRFGHTLVRNVLYFVDEDYKLQGKVPLHETYMNPDALYDHNLDSVLRGMVTLNTQLVEPFTTEEIRGHLLQRYYGKYGLDLTAITIQRGRDHGIPPYVEWREYCNLPTANSWEDLQTFLPGAYVKELKKFYASVKDIDLMAGALGEKPLDGALLGPTYLCLLAKQFRSLRKGDRFWFENSNQPGSFTREQLKEIYKTSIARFLCNTSDGLKTVPKHSFIRISEENPIVRCDDLPQINLTLWTN